MRVTGLLLQSPGLEHQVGLEVLELRGETEPEEAEGSPASSVEQEVEA